MSQLSAPDAGAVDGDDSRAVDLDGDVLATAQGAVGVVRETSAAVDDELQDINDLAESQVEDMSTVAEDVTDLSAMIEEVASSAAQMSDRSDHAADAATDGRNAAADAAESMDDVEQIVETVAEDVERLVESVERIDEIVDVIGSIADETNLLALNASIQAAQAGDAGDGFGIVADEVKSLANQSRERTTEVETVVSDIKTATDTLSERLESAVDVAKTGSERATDAETELETVTEAVDDVASGLEDISSATAEGAAASERVAHSCEETAEAADRIDAALEDIDADRYRQTDMIAEVDEALEVATAPRRRQLTSVPSIPSGLDAVDAPVGGFPRGCRGVVSVDTETPDSDGDEPVATLVGAALEAGYSVSLSPTATLDRRTLERTLKHRGVDLRRAFDRNRLFVIDLFDNWTGGDNVFGVKNRSLGDVNERIDRQRDQPLVVIGNIAGELHAFGEQATRETTYDNDGGVLEATDTVINVVDEDPVPSTLAKFYADAADQVVRIEAGPTLEVTSSATEKQ